MTALLACDGCGSIVSDRPDDDDPTATWWCLSASPAIGMGLLPTISFNEELVEMDDDDAPPEDPPPVEPDRHFCSIDCVGKWTTRRQTPEAGTP